MVSEQMQTISNTIDQIFGLRQCQCCDKHKPNGEFSHGKRYLSLGITERICMTCESKSTIEKARD
jgi:hypothetical protein